MRLSPADQKRIDALTQQVKDLTVELTELRAERDAINNLRSAEDRERELKEKIETLKIEKARIEEDNARKLREVEHKVGLETKRAEQERELAIRDAQLKVREENLDTERELFKRGVQVTKDAIAAEVDGLRTLVTKLVDAMPDVKTTLTVAAGGSNGRRAGEDD